MNEVHLMGNLGKEPEFRTFPSGGELASFSLATNEKMKDKDGQFKTITEWHEVIVQGEGQIKILKESAKKGSYMYVCGKINTQSWVDKESGQKRSKKVIKARLFVVSSEIKQDNVSEDPIQSHAMQRGPSVVMDDDIPF